MKIMRVIEMDRIEISEPEIDVIGHLFKLGIKKATLSLSWVSGNDVKIIPTNFEVVPFSAFQENSQLDGNNLISIMQRFAGAYSCCAILFFTKESAESLCRALMEEACADNEFFFEEETIMEISNIIINACLSNIATMLKKKISGGLPSYKQGGCQDVTRQVRNMDEQYKVIVVPLEMRCGSHVVNFNFILSMDRDSMSSLRGDVQDYLWDMH